ncbi:threonine/homoserine/homoserine lactone efflux protein [Geodermatophilus normandii]|uniref:Threonine/homoserine/homoserine lactone efflux protein n=1 Tax=Geodermatophilus normandii TaxID=1137989 RepID=A0A317QE42_9ACTN|nr:LysE family translocator [Geodermatophilus normandii]PWW21642.1 threonine/homoserine/homoserine lactone efflux protein [Geodermatophilus normandii]
MDAIPSWPAFLVAVVLVAASPGPAMALVLRRAALGGYRAAVPTVLGLELGLYAWALLAAAGFAGLVAASEAAFLVLRVVGAAVLCWLGVQALRAAWRERRAGRSGGLALPAPRRGGWAGFGEGVVVQLANPKAAVFMIAFYPQFVPADRPLFATTAVLALVQVALETVLYLSLAAGVARAGAWFRRPRVRTWLEGVSGAVLLGLGLRVAGSGR